MEAEVFDAFRSIGVGDEKASAAAQALSRRDPDMIVLKGDVATLKSDVSALKIDVGTLKIDVAGLKVDVALLKWMVGFSLALSVAILLKLFVK